ncbi:SPOR domain-containing protein [Qipengyuania sp. 1XM1-15A]|nr:SPOR domain-containing protein [Qipengyuania xiamenensis]MBX7533083.1 SPOR domain-containing protein [Qipengyuania xiamenensis]
MTAAGKYLVALGSAAIAVVCAGPALADTRSGVIAWNAGDYSAAVREWQAPAAQGDANAQFNLAQAYRYGRGVSQDLTRAEELYAAAAASGHEDAADLYGILLFQRGAEAEALPYLRTAARRGNTAARYFLSLAHFNGDVAEKDWPLAYALASLADVGGLPQATRALGRMDPYLSAEQKREALLLAEQIGESGLTPKRDISLMAMAPGAKAEPTRQVRTAAPAPAPSPAPAAQRQAETQVRTASADRAAGPWKVQLGAFGVPGNVGRMWDSVAALPEIEGRERIEKPAGRLTILQAGGYASRSQANAACAALKRRGHDCLVTR